LFYLSFVSGTVAQSAHSEIVTIWRASGQYTWSLTTTVEKITAIWCQGDHHLTAAWFYLSCGFHHLPIATLNDSKQSMNFHKTYNFSNFTTRSMAVSLSMLVGRFGSTVSSNILGNLLDEYCYLTYNICAVVALICFGM
jgi:hypothetical protein